MKNHSLYINTKLNRRKFELLEEDKELLERYRYHFEERIRDFSKVPRDRWIREIAFCLLTPQSTPFNSERALLALEKKGLFEQELPLSKVEAVLRDPAHYVRFHRSKAKRLVMFQNNIHKLKEVIFSGLNATEERQRLVELISGFGLKEASHALRNIGRRGLAILDRHILRTLQCYGVIKETPLRSLTRERYLKIEMAFIEWGDSLSEDIDTLDLLFWAKATGLIFK